MAGKICGQHQKERMSHSLLTFQETRININILDVCPVPLSLITVLAERELCFSSFQEVFLPWHFVLLRHLSYQPPSSPQSFLQPENFECYGFFFRYLREQSSQGEISGYPNHTSLEPWAYWSLTITSARNGGRTPRIILEVGAELGWELRG